MQRKAQKKNKEFILRKVDAARFAEKNEGQKKAFARFISIILISIYIFYSFTDWREYI